MMYVGAQDSGTFKIPIANPSHAVAQLIQDYRFKVFKIGQGMAFAG